MEPSSYSHYCLASDCNKRRNSSYLPCAPRFRFFFFFFPFFLLVFCLLISCCFSWFTTVARSLGSVNHSANLPLSVNPEDQFSRTQSAASIFGTICGSVQQPRRNSNSNGQPGNTACPGFPLEPFRSDFGINQTADGLAQHPWWKSNFAGPSGSTVPSPNLLGKNETLGSTPNFAVITCGNLVRPDATTITPSPFGIAPGFPWTILPGLSAGNTCEDCRKAKVPPFAPTLVPSEGPFVRLQSISAVHLSHHRNFLITSSAVSYPQARFLS